ncbi:hypothetical protein ACFO4O_05630 [Glaciecola siphonariae]|uniref:Uncharacterized protein n=1 Tax=Glaciecola siphonariae TaxID=521012 RepID=A0ABV9LUU5_9ALTE
MIKQINTGSDTNTQAMTEVALGLSMAFFSLLIIALLSMSAGTSTQSQGESSGASSEQQDAARKDALESEAVRAALESLEAQHRLSLSEQAVESTRESNAQTEQNSELSEQAKIRFVFYYKRQYFDAQLNKITPDTSDSQLPTVVAVMPDMSFSQVMKVHQDFSQQEIQITAMDENWQRAFRKMVEANSTQNNTLEMRSLAAVKTTHSGR